MESNKLIISIAIIAIVIGALISNDWELFQVNPDLFENSSSVFLKYGIIIIAIERAAMVYIGIQFETKKKSIKSDIKSLDEELLSLENQINSGSLTAAAVTSTRTNLDKILTKKTTKNTELADHKNVVQRIALRIVFYGGILLAIGGLSILNDMFYTPDTWSDCTEGMCRVQMYIFRFLDIVITGGLIGGGSKSFHKFLSNIDQYVESRK